MSRYGARFVHSTDDNGYYVEVSDHQGKTVWTSDVVVSRNEANLLLRQWLAQHGETDWVFLG